MDIKLTMKKQRERVSILMYYNISGCENGIAISSKQMQPYSCRAPHLPSDDPSKMVN